MHRRLVLLVSVVTVTACSGSSEPSPPPASATDAAARAQPAQPPTPTAPPAPAEPASPPPAPAPPPGRVREALGAPTVAILEGPSSVEVVALNYRDTRAADANGSWPLDRMAYYRMRGTPRPVDAALAAQVVAVILDEANYDWETRRRCARRQLVGLRYRRGDERADVVFGQNCEQVEIVSFGADGARLVDWAGWYTPARARVDELLGQAMQAPAAAP